MRFGAKLQAERRNCSFDPARGGSISRTSSDSPSLASLSMKCPASSAVKSAFSMPLWRAFSRASLMADATLSTPITRAAWAVSAPGSPFAATRPMVPVPQ